MKQRGVPDWRERIAARREKEARLLSMVRGDLDVRDVDRGVERARRRREADAPVFSECVIGYRQWNVDALDQLWPITAARRPWEPGVNEAKCNRTPGGVFRVAASGLLSFDVEAARVPDHKAPHKECECGLYAWRELRPDWAAAWRVSDYLSMPPVVGAVAFWGDVRVHRDGFRAEKACIVALSYRPDERAEVYAVLDRVARRYRVELVAYSDLPATAAKHGSPLPDTLQPPRNADPDFRPGSLVVGPAASV